MDTTSNGTEGKGWQVQRSRGFGQPELVDQWLRHFGADDARDLDLGTLMYVGELARCCRTTVSL
jgi:murein endopeptidase